ncbi:N-acetylneuraminate synthase [Haloplanus litoreus]|uniref:N-acetylneuraminate synthase n=2 Tax=Haloplanus litoreus TaxID=767515 RepID=A0ABD5ZXQ1_9EURY
MQINGHTVGADGPFVIAEVGINHNGEMAMARSLIDAAVDAGADAVKFQSFVVEELVTASAPKAEYQEGSTGESQREMLEPYELTPEQHRELQSYCSKRDITFLSTPFDSRSLTLLDDLDVPAIKIGSGELTNIPFLREIAETGRSMIVSTGMSTMDEVETAVEAIRDANPHVPLALLHCVSLYPTDIELANLRAMQTMDDRFDVPIGFSDHTTQIETMGLAVAMGATVVEKHLTLDRSLPGPDHEASLEPDELDRAVDIVRNAERAKGSPEKRPVGDEMDTAAIARKSLHATTDIESGTTLTADHVQITRPVDGLQPNRYDDVLGRRLAESLALGDPITEEVLLD